jgi:hypothetical protein
VLLAGGGRTGVDAASAGHTVATDDGAAKRDGDADIGCRASVVPSVNGTAASLVDVDDFDIDRRIRRSA